MPSLSEVIIISSMIGPQRRSSTRGSSRMSLPRTPPRPRLRRGADLRQHLGIRAAGALQHLEAVVGGLEPVHRKGGGEALENALHQLLLAERVAGAVQAEDRLPDLRQVGVAQLFGLSRRVKWIGEEDEPVAGE